MKTLLLVGVALAIGLVGFLILGIGLVGVFDPEGSQAANDNDPFGVPPPLAVQLMPVVIGLIMLAVGGGIIWLQVRPRGAV